MTQRERAADNPVTGGLLRIAVGMEGVVLLSECKLSNVCRLRMKGELISESHQRAGCSRAGGKGTETGARFILYL